MIEDGEELGELYVILKGYDSFTEVPEGSPVKKGEILTATGLVANPLFGGSEIIILAYSNRNGFDAILGVSLQRDHPAYLSPAIWDIEQLRNEIDAGAWNRKGSLEGSIRDYFKKINGLELRTGLM